MRGCDKAHGVGSFRVLKRLQVWGLLCALKSPEPPVVGAQTAVCGYYSPNSPVCCEREDVDHVHCLWQPSHRHPVQATKKSGPRGS